MLKLLPWLLLTLGLLAGCGQVVIFGHTVGDGRANSASEPASKPKGQATSTPAAHRVKAVTLALTPEATQKVAGDPRFKADALRDAVEGELRSRQLLDVQDPQASGTAEILIDDFAIRATSNAVVFGRIPSAGTLIGDIRIRDANGNALPADKISAEARMSLAANGNDKNPLQDLYRRFAVLVADNLAGIPSKSEDTSGNVIPR